MDEVKTKNLRTIKSHSSHNDYQLGITVRTNLKSIHQPSKSIHEPNVMNTK